IVSKASRGPCYRIWLFGLALGLCPVGCVLKLHNQLCQFSNTPGGNDWIAIAAGNDYSIALDVDGSILGWGQPFAVGTGTAGVDWPLGNNFIAIDGGNYHGLALQSAVPIPATVWLFGSALGLLGWIRRKTA
ncbi:MAG: hypothetical protein QF483_07725, partial [Gammaproteobacteria bacterium]|nr:hypothetical protein [Gammaproteobacteria bacterium]